MFRLNLLLIFLYFKNDEITTLKTKTSVGHTDTVWSCCWSPDGKRIASVGADNWYVIIPQNFQIAKLEISVSEFGTTMAKSTSSNQMYKESMREAFIASAGQTKES